MPITHNVHVVTINYNKLDEFNFEIVCFLFMDVNIATPWYGIFFSQLILSILEYEGSLVNMNHRQSGLSTRYAILGVI